MAKARQSMKGFPDTSFKPQLAPLDSLNLAGKRLVVVGGTDGLGRAISALAASKGADVTVVGRTFRDAGVDRISFVKADLSSMKEAARVGRELRADADVVLLTTGIFAAPKREETAEGIERDLAISYLSRLALLREYGPRLVSGRSGAAPRVFVMGFPGAGNEGDASDLNADRSYDAMAVHMNTVAGNEMLVLDAKRRWPGLAVFGLNPGLIKTGIRSNFLGDGSLKHRLAEFMIGLMMPSAARYAAWMVPLLFAKDLEAHAGKMFGQKANPILPTETLDGARVAAFMEASEALLVKAGVG